MLAYVCVLVYAQQTLVLRVVCLLVLLILDIIKFAAAA